MISFDREDSSKKIDEIGQTLIADSWGFWGFNRLSNVLTESQTDQVIDLLLSGNYANGDAAFARRNSDVLNPLRLSAEWEVAIKNKWNDMFVTERTRVWRLMRPEAPVLTDIRIWT